MIKMDVNTKLLKKLGNEELFEVVESTLYDDEFKGHKNLKLIVALLEELIKRNLLIILFLDKNGKEWITDTRVLNGDRPETVLKMCRNSKRTSGEVVKCTIKEAGDKDRLPEKAITA